VPCARSHPGTAQLSHLRPSVPAARPEDASKIAHTQLIQRACPPGEHARCLPTTMWPTRDCCGSCSSGWRAMLSLTVP
jgi:hypothetical protein